HRRRGGRRRSAQRRFEEQCGGQGAEGGRRDRRGRPELGHHTRRCGEAGRRGEGERLQGRHLPDLSPGRLPMGGGPDRPGLTQGPSARPASHRPAVIVAGPTASGKSALALAIARAFDGVVINADSMQVYRELRILTARPGAAGLALAPHRLYGVLPAAERCSAGRWRQMAEAVAAETDRMPVFAGGTGLYLRALTEGLSEIPPVPGEIAAEGAAKLSALGAAGLHAEL